VPLHPRVPGSAWDTSTRSDPPPPVRLFFTSRPIKPGAAILVGLDPGRHIFVGYNLGRRIFDVLDPGRHIFVGYNLGRRIFDVLDSGRHILCWLLPRATNFRCFGPWALLVTTSGDQFSMFWTLGGIFLLVTTSGDQKTAWLGLHKRPETFQTFQTSTCVIRLG
jgi:hypothetical protein